jgi:hypothetical protein
MSTLRSPVLVGRGSELATELRLVHSAARGQGGTLIVTGEAGVGKSRLVAELSARAAEAGLAVLIGRTVEGGGSYRALGEALARPLRGRSSLDSTRLGPYRASLHRLISTDGTGGTEGAESAADVEAGAQVETGAQVEAGKGAGAGYRPDPTVVLGEGVLGLLSPVGAERGCLLVLEDLHWADPDTVDLVRYLADATSGDLRAPGADRAR